MKIVLLVNKSGISNDGIYRVNMIYNALKKNHEILILQCKAHKKTNNKKQLVEKIKNLKIKNIPEIIDNKLVVYFKNRIITKVQKKLGNLKLNPDIPYFRINSNFINSTEVVNELRQIQPNLMIHISGNILKKNIYSIPELGTLNLHHGVLPYIRGLDSMYWGIYYGKQRWVGATVHYIDEGIDTGEVIIKKEYNYKKNKSLSEIIIGIEELAAELIISSVNMLTNKKKLDNKGSVQSKNSTFYKSRAPLNILLVVLFKIFIQRLDYFKKLNPKYDRKQ
jgi:methionyl-tRNA formyltransferase